MPVFGQQVQGGDGFAAVGQVAHRLLLQHGDPDPVALLGEERRGVEAPVRRQRIPEPEVEAASLLPPPALAGVGGEGFAEMTVVKEVFRSKDPVLIAQQADPGVVAAGGVVGDTQDPVHAAGHDAAVGKYGNGFAGIGLCDLRQGFLEPAGIVLVGFRPGGDPMLRVPCKPEELLRLTPLQLSEGPVLPGPHKGLPEPGLLDQGQLLGAADRLGGLAGAAEVAGVDPVDLHRSEPVCQGLHLPQAVAGETGIVLSVEPAEDVSLRLRVPNQKNLSHIIIP